MVLFFNSGLWLSGVYRNFGVSGNGVIFSTEGSAVGIPWRGVTTYA